MVSDRVDTSYFDSAMEVAESGWRGFYYPQRGHILFDSLRRTLAMLKSFFVVFSLKLDHLQNAKLASFLQKIEQTVRRHANQFHPLPLGDDGYITPEQGKVFHQFQLDVLRFLNKAQKWYITMEDSLLRHSLVTVGEISAIIDSNLGILEFINSNLKIETIRFFDGLNHPEEEPTQIIKAEMTLWMKFLRSLICFAHEPTQTLLAHAEAVSIHLNLVFMRNLEDALYGLEVYLVHNARYEEDDDGESDKVRLLALVEKIKPSNLLSSETYNQALRSSKLSRQSLSSTPQDMDDGTFIATDNFLYSLISVLWEMLRRNTGSVVSSKDHLREFFEGLRSLRSILWQQKAQQPNNIIPDIVEAVCDAGVLCSSLNQTNMEPNLGMFQDFTETISSIRTKVGGADPQLPTFNFPTTNQLGFVDFVTQKLIELTSGKSQHVQTIHDELVSIRPFLGDIVKLHRQHEELQTLWDRILKMAYKVESFIDSLLVDTSDDLFSGSFDSIMEDIRNIKMEMQVRRPEIESRRPEIQAVKEGSGKWDPVVSQKTTLLTPTDEVVGLVDDAKVIMDQLKRDTKQLRVVAIVGMAGLGKTTFASKIYNHSSISHRFAARAWCPISQVVNKKNVLSELMKQIDPRVDLSELKEQDYEEKLWRMLKGKKYLIFLDDVWDMEALDSLTISFPDDKVGSRILLTSRYEDVVPEEMLLDGKVHLLRNLNGEESLELLNRKLSPREEDLNSDLVKQIAVYCKGLPLTIMIVAGLMATTGPKGWEQIRDDLSSGSASVTEHCYETLERSYGHLPDYLRPCLLYFGTFPEDERVSVEKLLYLWIGEGFVREVEGKRKKDVAEEYLKSLIGRSLIFVSRGISDVGAETCYVHDLVHSFCLQKAEAEQFFHLVKGVDELRNFSEPCSLRRLCIHSEPSHFWESKLFSPRARSLLFHRHKSETGWLPPVTDASFVIGMCKLLMVLDMYDMTLFSEFPSDIEELVQLSFLAISGHFLSIPSCIGKLTNLETLILWTPFDELSFPDSLWNLRKLKLIEFSGSKYYGGFVISLENLDNSPVLCELEKFWRLRIPFGSNIELLMRKFPNVGSLKFIVCQGDDGSGMDSNGIIFPDFLLQLESLELSWDGGFRCDGEFELSFPASLKTLTLDSCDFCWGAFSIIGKLPNLEVLRLHWVTFKEGIWEMKEGDFSKLKFLRLYRLENLARWTADNVEFGSLEILVLSWCTKIEELPDGLEKVVTLKMIEIDHCTETAQDWARQVEEKQVEDWGNSEFKVIISS
ncbi:OLC1v1014216C1 [Oldenlandia corymbosa var. corymbosa]|uniref:OLC1v1014216C1 n=1 Tax=Oldenlandia corymbosa var. corymbosa TaxID=529605 RepID=A0AAV1E2P5_OLDCO|nr:OLC1v1014216C1 [Oldenlandia corymbosa var. corymbosa]